MCGKIKDGNIVKKLFLNIVLIMLKIVDIFSTIVLV